MLRLKSLGQSVIEAGEARVMPAAETVFATALYLVIEAGRPVSRDELTRLLWPDVSDTQAQHGLRQAVYRLRSFGAKIETERSSLLLSPEYCSTDFGELLAPQTPAALESLADQIGGSFLPGYRPQLSDAFATWVDRQRDVVHSAVARTLMVGMQAKKRVSDWNGAERLAAKCLAIDPLNEEATLTLAEAAALGGSKTKALSILNHYLEDIGEGAGEIKLPAVILRRRISEAYQDNVFPIRDAPFVGREEEMAELTRALAKAQSGHGSAYVITGEPGIGKTRLLSEFTRVAALQRLHIVRVGCQSHDVRRPLSVFVDLVPKLLALPGALGCSPESMQYLRRLVAHDPDQARMRDESDDPSISYAQAGRSVFDVMDCISSEGCVLLEIEDAHWLDQHSLRMVEEIGNWLPDQRFLLVLTSRTQTHRVERISTIMLRPLPNSASAVVARAIINQDLVSKEAFLTWCVSSSGGNPYFLIELLRNGTTEPSGYHASTSLTRLLKDRVLALGPDARGILEACCVLSKHSTFERINRCLGISRVRVLTALSELEAFGMIEVDGPRVMSRHDILSTAVLSQMSASSKVMLHRYAAEELEADATKSQSVALIWESSEHWLAAADSRRAFLLLRRCGNYLMDVGMPDEAAAVFERAEQLAVESRDKYDAGTERARALVRADQSAEAITVLDRLLGLREALNPPPPMLDEVRVMYMLAKWDEGHAIPPLISDVLKGLSSDAVPAPERVSAATWLLMAADNLCDVTLGREVYERVREDLNRAGVSTDSRLSCEMTFHCAFGDASVAAGTADELCEYARRSCPRDVALRYLRYAAHVHRCHSSAERSLIVSQEALEFAEKINARLAITSSLSVLLGHALQNGNLDAAREWLRRIANYYTAGDRTVLDCNLSSYRTEFAIRTGDLDDARTHFSSCRQFANRTGSARSMMRSQALEMQIRVLSGEKADALALQSSMALFNTTKFSSFQDFSLESLLVALKSVGDLALAKSASLDFVSRDRRDLAPLSPYLAAAIESL